MERANGYLETSFLPGRRFEDVAVFNRQLGGWLIKANHRVHATAKVRPSEAMAEDRGSMLAFPAVPPDPSLRFSTRLARDHYVRAERAAVDALAAAVEERDLAMYDRITEVA